MMRQAIAGFLAAASALNASAGEFPLAFKTLGPESVQSFPGNTGGYGQLMMSKPSRLKKEPPRASKRPLYGELRAVDEAGRVFRLDESKGDGKGYDQLIIDFNGNGDLTDEVVVQPIESGATNPSRSMRQQVFGPITAPAEIAGVKPVYYARCYIYTPPQGLAEQALENHYYGQLLLKAGWYLEAEAQFDGKKVRIGFYDGDANFRIGDEPKAVEYRNSGQPTMWYIGGGDNLLVDENSSGDYTYHSLFRESRPYSEVLYMGTTPYRVKANSDLKSVSVEPWAEELAEVKIEKQGDQVRSLMLAQKGDKADWQVFCLSTENGKFKVPPGAYRLYACTMADGSGSGRVLAAGYHREAKDPVEFALRKANVLNCGGPLTLKTEAEKREPQPWENIAEKSATDSDFVLAINATVLGAAGEIYSTYAKGEKYEDSPSQPAFTVSSGGKQIARGNLEFG